MATTIKKGLLCRDGEFENGVFPYTGIDCVFDDNGNPLTNKIDNKVSKSGDTMTGKLAINIDGGNAIDFVTGADTKTNPSATKYMYGISVKDSNDRHISTLETIYRTSGRMDTGITSYNYKGDGSRVVNTLQLGIDKEGNKTVSVSEKKPWLEGLGVVYKAGDTYKTTNWWITYGYISSGAKQLRFWTPIDKPITASNATLNKLIVTVRSSTGNYLIEGVEVVGSSDYTTVCNVSNGGLRLGINKATAFDTTNNTPIVVSIEELNVTFS